MPITDVYDATGIFSEKHKLAQNLANAVMRWERVPTINLLKRFEAGPQHANPMGTLHGGVLCDVADAAMRMAFASTLAADESFTTINLSMNFFRPVWNERLRAEARVITLVEKRRIHRM